MLEFILFNEVILNSNYNNILKKLQNLNINYNNLIIQSSNNVTKKLRMFFSKF